MWPDNLKNKKPHTKKKNNNKAHSFLAHVRTHRGTQTGIRFGATTTPYSVQMFSPINRMHNNHCLIIITVVNRSGRSSNSKTSPCTALIMPWWTNQQQLLWMVQIWWCRDLWWCRSSSISLHNGHNNQQAAWFPPGFFTPPK